MQTQAALEEHLPRVLANLAHDYLRVSRPGYSAFGIGSAGYGELCAEYISAFDATELFEGACAGNHPELAESIAARARARDGKFCADSGLWWGCRGGHIDTVMVAIGFGATDLNRGLGGACAKMRDREAKLMIRLGADWCSWCGRKIEEHRLGGVQSSGGGAIQQLIGTGKQDVMLMAAKVSNRRVRPIERLRDKASKPNTGSKGR